MTKKLLPALTTFFLISFAHFSFAQAPIKWKIHDPNRPLPPIIDPGTASTQEKPGRPPSDAAVLFDGKDPSGWIDEHGKPAKWKVENGYMEVVAGTGYIHTRDSFGDCQLHVEFAEPSPGVGESQDRGNSGVFLMGLYEIQVLDSYQNKTYADGQAAAVYGQYPPLVNASRPPAQWQTYDVVFHGPRFTKDGKLSRPARMTVLHNGVLVQDNVALTGPTAHGERPPYKPQPEKLPLALQDHGNPVRFRNIWIRQLKEE
jgi:3-keto-disaccharide hydrolase